MSEKPLAARGHKYPSEGWMEAKPTHRFHYVVDGIALCANWIEYKKRELVPFDPKVRDKKDCPRCWGLAYKRTNLLSKGTR